MIWRCTSAWSFTRSSKTTLLWGGHHGVAHWARVLENGLRIAAESKAVIEVVRLFAVLHDSRGSSEHSTPSTVRRAAEFARTLEVACSTCPTRFRLLHRACAGHTHERTHPDVTIQTCWDADRLDLGRVGMFPDHCYLSTEIAKRPETIRWADERAASQFVPDLVLEEWKIDLTACRRVLS